MPAIQAPFGRALLTRVIERVSSVGRRIVLGEPVTGAEIVFRSGPIDGGILAVTINKEFDFSFTEPAIRQLSVRQKRAHIPSLALHAIEDRVRWIRAGCGVT